MISISVSNSPRRVLNDVRRQGGRRSIAERPTRITAGTFARAGTITPITPARWTVPEKAGRLPSTSTATIQGTPRSPAVPSYRTTAPGPTPTTQPTSSPTSSVTRSSCSSPRAEADLRESCSRLILEQVVASPWPSAPTGAVVRPSTTRPSPTTGKCTVSSTAAARLRPLGEACLERRSQDCPTGSPVVYMADHLGRLS